MDDIFKDIRRNNILELEKNIKQVIDFYGSAVFCLGLIKRTYEYKTQFAEDLIYMLELPSPKKQFEDYLQSNGMTVVYDMPNLLATISKQQ